MSAPSPSSCLLSPCTVLRIAGPDRERFLNGQVTQDVQRARGRHAVFSAVLNAKGQLEAVCHIREEGGAFLVDAPRDLRDDLLARLDRYLIADEVELEDESDRWYLAHRTGPSAPDPSPDVLLYECDRFGSPGWDLLSREPIPPALLPNCDSQTVERARIDAGVPAWNRELLPGLLPPEAGLDRNAISYDKGCYLGQEVVSRMKRAGKTNRHLVRLRAPAGTPLPASLITNGDEAGTVTSLADGPAGEPVVGLGFRRRKFETHTRFTLAGEDGTELPGAAEVTAVV